MSKHGLSVINPSDGGRVVRFTSEKRLDMKELKARWVICSYRIQKVTRVVEMVEEG